MAERLRRMLKAHVRKSVGSIPTDCISFLFSFFFLLVSRRGGGGGVWVPKVGELRWDANTPGIAQLAERETVDGYN